MTEFDEHWITTYTGKKFHYLNPKSEEIDIKDIAHGLSLTCRFAGQCKIFYSVAEHSVRVADLVPQETKLLALLHDAGEAYVPDIPRPMKQDIAEFKAIEGKILYAILMKFGVDCWNFGLVKEADSILLASEARDLMHNMDGWAELPKPLHYRIIPITSQAAENVFLTKFKEYSK